MKGDFTRDTFRPEKHYRQVLMQQGRVQLDADGNEQTAIAARRDETTAADLIGGCGGPAEGASFRITPDAAISGDFRLSTGRYYVNGQQCEVEEALLFTAQPDCPGLKKLGEGQYLVYLDVWQRHVTALDDEGIREPALGGPDTATRSKTVWQVRVAPLDVPFDPNNPPPDPCHLASAEFDKLKRPALPLLAAKTADATPDADPCTVPAGAGYRGLENQLYRVEIHDTGNSVAPSTPADGTPVDSLEGDKLVVNGLNCHVGDAVEIFLVESDASGTRVTERAIAWVIAVENSGTTFTLNFAPTLTGTRRVRKVNATWKWSRENGCIVYGIRSLKTGTRDHLELADRPLDESRGLHAGDWVELLNDELELNGNPGQMAQIINPDDAGFVSLSAPLDANLFPGDNLGAHARLRRWEGVGVVSIDPSVDGGFLPLEQGITVQFEQPAGAEFRTGDFWQTPTRTASPDALSGKIEWPATDGKPEALPPKGIIHDYCRLGVVAVDNTGVVTVISDCRCLWPALTSVPRLFYVSGDGQEVMPDLTAPASRRFKLPHPLIVGVANAQCLKRRVTVRFEVVNPSIGLVAASGVSPTQNRVDIEFDAEGLAKCDFHLDGTNVSQQVTARLLDATNNPVSLPVVFNANLSIASQVAFGPGDCSGLAGQKTVQDAVDRLARMVSIYKVSGDGQQAPAGAQLKEPLLVRVASRCGPVSKMQVTFQVILGGGSVSPNASATDDNGEAKCAWTLGKDSILQVVEATVVGDLDRPVTEPSKVHYMAHLAGEGSNDPLPVRIVGLQYGSPPKRLANDQILTLEQLGGGLFFFCDRRLDSRTVVDPVTIEGQTIRRGQPTCFITAEIPYPLLASELGDCEPFEMRGIAGFRPIVLFSEVRVKVLEESEPGPGDERPRSVILWQPAPGAGQFLSGVLNRMSALKPAVDKLLLRVTLKGNFIWSDAAVELLEERGILGGYLDGDSFRAPRKADASGLLLPSGDNRRGGDFEMWFWLMPKSAAPAPPGIVEPDAVDPMVAVPTLTDAVSDAPGPQPRAATPKIRKPPGKSADRLTATDETLINPEDG